MFPSFLYSAKGVNTDKPTFFFLRVKGNEKGEGEGEGRFFFFALMKICLGLRKSDKMDDEATYFQRAVQLIVDWHVPVKADPSRSHRSNNVS